MAKDWKSGPSKQAWSEPAGKGVMSFHFSPRAGCVLPAVGSAIAVIVGGVTAAVPQGSSFIWPSFTVIITLRSIWRGKSQNPNQRW